GKTVIFVLPTKVAPPFITLPGFSGDDDHVFGGSLYTVPWDPMAHTFGTATPLITSAGENNYYPGYSPDGSFIAFNRVPLTGTVATIDTCVNTTGIYGGTCPNDSFSNPKARIMLMANKAGATPVDVENLNGSPAKSPIDLSNSWPRWSPFLQTYKG